MPDPDQRALALAFRQLKQSGQLEAVLFVLREEFKLNEVELRTHLLGVPLVDIPAVAQTHMLQGRMKACETLLQKMLTLAAGPAPTQ